MWARMLDKITDFRTGQIDLRSLVDDLRGLRTEADPHDPTLQADFEWKWAELEMELELRTEPWAPAGSASDERLNAGLEALDAFVRQVLAADVSDDHT